MNAASRIALASLALAGAFAAGAAGPATVTIDGSAFSPATITVKKGATVRWVNKDPFPHTATAQGVFDSKEIAAGKSWKYVARKPGRYEYICTLHPNMKGTLVVQ